MSSQTKDVIKDRHYYYQELKDNPSLFDDKDWLKEAMQCTLSKHAKWSVDQKNLDTIIQDVSFSIEDFLDFIALENKTIADKLRALEESSSFVKR